MMKGSSRAGGQAGKSRSGFRNIAVWQESQAFAADVARLVLKLPRNDATQPIGNQLIRSSASIAANIAEGFGRFSPRAYYNYLSIARASAYETESWIDLLARLEFISPEQERELLGRLDRIEAMLTTRMNALAKQTTVVREEAEGYTA